MYFIGRHSPEDPDLYLDVGSPEERREEMKENMNGGRVLPVPSVLMLVSKKELFP